MARSPLLLPLTLFALLTACSDPPPVPDDEPLDPNATALRDSIQAPQDKARAVEQQVLDAAEQQREAIDAATGD